MNAFKLIGCAGIAGVALVVYANSTTLAETSLDSGAVAEKSGNLVHRVSHTLAAAEEYTGNVPSGYKWGADGAKNNGDRTDAPAAGYKWGNYKVAGAGKDHFVPSNFSEQARNPWGRRDFSEQARNPWGRRDFSEQARNPWGRR